MAINNNNNTPILNAIKKEYGIAPDDICMHCSHFGGETIADVGSCNLCYDPNRGRDQDYGEYFDYEKRCSDEEDE